VTISLNGEPYELDVPLSVTALLARLGIDPRRVAVEHNTVVVRRALFDETVIDAGDQVEIVNFVGGGESAGPSGLPTIAPPWRGANVGLSRRFFHFPFFVFHHIGRAWANCLKG
jgi:thiamine biosynthesis protein ThiS